MKDFAFFLEVFFEDYIFAWWNIWISLILLNVNGKGHNVTHPLFTMKYLFLRLTHPPIVRIGCQIDYIFNFKTLSLLEQPNWLFWPNWEIMTTFGPGDEGGKPFMFFVHTPNQQAARTNNACGVILAASDNNPIPLRLGFCFVPDVGVSGSLRKRRDEKVQILSPNCNVLQGLFLLSKYFNFALNWHGDYNFVWIFTNWD